MVGFFVKCGRDYPPYDKASTSNPHSRSNTASRDASGLPRPNHSTASVSFSVNKQYSQFGLIDLRAFHQLPAPSTSNSHRQSSGKERRRAVSLPSLSKESNNRYPKRRKALQQTPQQDTSTYNPIFERPEEGPKASESEEDEKDDPISYWAANLTWPDNFAEPRAISSSNNSNKRQRTTDHSQSVKEGKSWTYSQSRRNGNFPGQNTKAYENYISTTGLDMNEFKGRKLVSSESLETCKFLQTITCKTISHTIYSSEETLKVVELCRNRNKATVARNITSLILPPIISFYLKDKGNQFEHLIDEVDTMWRESWVLAGPRPKPDLAVGFVSSDFTSEENEKLTYYTSFENITRPTDNLSFPFLISKIKCGNEGLDYADRQNMHSCSVAVKVILKLEQKADQYQEDKQSIPSHTIKNMPAFTGIMRWLKEKIGRIIATTLRISILDIRRGTY